MSIWIFIRMFCSFFNKYESALPIHMKCGSIHKGHFIFLLGPGSDSQSESRWQVLLSS